MTIYTPSTVRFSSMNQVNNIVSAYLKHETAYFSSVALWRIELCCISFILLSKFSYEWISAQDYPQWNGKLSQSGNAGKKSWNIYILERVETAKFSVQIGRKANTLYNLC